MSIKDSRLLIYQMESHKFRKIREKMNEDLKDIGWIVCLKLCKKNNNYWF